MSLHGLAGASWSDMWWQVVWNPHETSEWSAGGTPQRLSGWRSIFAVDHLATLYCIVRRSVPLLFFTTASPLSVPATMSAPVLPASGDSSGSSTPAPRNETSFAANGTEDTPLTSPASFISPIDATTPSWKPNYDLRSPPDIIRPYKAEEALEDIPGVSYALEVFLSSHMLESEDYCHKMDEIKYVFSRSKDWGSQI
jgi:hypothetical protein